MRRITTFLIYLLIYTIGISAQSRPTSVQGIPYDFDLLPTSSKKVRSIQSSTSGKFPLDDIKFWVGEGENEAALAIDWYYDDETALVWGYRWDGDAYGIDMIEAIAQADPRLVLLIQETNLGYTIAGIGYADSPKDFMLSYDLASVKNDSNISFGFDEPNSFLGQQSVPNDPLQEITDAIEEGIQTGVIYHPLNHANYGYACYDYDHWTSLSSTTKWRSAWYTGYWSYQVKDSQEEAFMYSGLGATLRKLTNESWDGWGFQDGWNSWEGVAPRAPFTAVLPLITLNERNVTFEPGNQLQLTATLHPEKATDKKISWLSSDPEIVSVDGNGLITALSIGTVTVTAFINEENIIAGFCTVNSVEVPVTGIAISPVSYEMTNGEELQPEITFTPENATNQNVIWISSNEEVATVSKNGLVKAVGNGKATITVITEDGEKTANCQLLCIVSVEGISILPEKEEMKVDEKLQLIATILPQNATDQSINWESSNPGIATVSKKGLVNAVSEGKVTISATTTDGGYIAECIITVKDDTNTIENVDILSHRVYPTVTKATVTILTEKATTIELTDITGRVLLSQPTDSPEILISLASYPNGIYFIIIENQITKIIKN